MNIKEVQDKAEEPVPEHHMMVTFSYNSPLVMTVSDAIKLFDMLKNVEVADGDYNTKKILPAGSKDMSIKFLSHKEYLKIKMDAILNSED